ncbi:ketosteroid isomerase-like protein [Inhella inkyongensis]|uniref:Ketosteroid isomerase-like protein n=1 Tax=Inhella inkyongensis TaxID=392593 RepID=A0A840S1Q4_9BURK|nr:nuclear transport factor 2 family protein [Inhella inkyongensis]MBB5203016.1 ketosteroid isomerase-like protein [Inhella inkyongensis]
MTPEDPRLRAVVAFYEGLRPEHLLRLGELYTEQAYFRDPFNEVRGLAAVQRIFAHMFEQLEAPRFEVLEAFAAQDQAFLTWDFHFLRGGQAQRIHGSSHLRFDASGRVAYHRDYWDAAEELWEKLPLLGGLLRALKRRLRAS